MGKFAGFLKRIKKVAGFGNSILTGLNDLYKGVKPYAENIISSYVPGGELINKGLNFGSKMIDNIQPYAQKYLVDEDNKEQLEKLNNNIKRYGGDITQKALNNYMDEQEAIYNNKGNYTLNDHAIKTGTHFIRNNGDAFSGLMKNKNSIFGNPLN